MPPATLPLDEQSLNPDELSLSTLMRELSLQQRPSWLLRMLMNALESKRQSRGMGWSRPWNKTGLNVFRTHLQNPTLDAAYLALLEPVLKQLLASVSDAYAAFARELLADPKRMSFTFYHNRQEGDRQYEGLTLSIGRKVEADPSKRDRLDLILEDLRVDGRVDGKVDRLRLYICPWIGFAPPSFKHHLTDFDGIPAHLETNTQELYHEAVRFYHQWKNEPARQWSHWSANYIDYFGPRSFIPIGTSFN